MKPGVPWYEMVMHGGMVRENVDFLSKHRGWYVIMPNGSQDVFTMNFVDGFSLGPHSIIGRMNLDRSRWELEETVRWAFNREALLCKAAIRYILPVEYDTFFELYGGQHTEDFDAAPTMPMMHSFLASSICGWNHFKLYEQTSAGFRFATPITFDLKISANIGWERRRRLSNSRYRNIFGAHAQSNHPRVRVPGTASDLMWYEGPINAELAKASVRFDYLHQRSLLVIDDMTVHETSGYPLLSLLLDFGTGKNRDADRFKFLSVDARASQSLVLPRENDLLSYMGSAGFMLSNGTIGLADMHHFDASRFWWQRSMDVSRFSLLDNYELSTSRRWIEGHVEWNSRRMLFNSLVPRQYVIWREFLQLHAVKVPDYRLHWEAQYGLDLMKAVRVGVSIGFDDATYRGAAVSMVLDINAMARKQPL